MGIADLHWSKRTREDGFVGCVLVIARLHLCIATLWMFIASGFAFTAGHLVGISTCEVSIAEAGITTARRNEVIALGEMAIALHFLSFHRLVIWHKITSSPGKSASTSAGRLLLVDKSEKGNGTTTTSPFTNVAMPRLLRG
jgi:hypothetical protein